MNNFLEFAITTAEQAGAELMKHFGTTPPITRGTPKEIKSVYDNLADNLIKKKIEEAFPDHSYLTEETGMIDKNSEYLWIIDPVDGTGNFVNSNPFFAISIALWHKGTPIVAVMEAPGLKERYCAVAGEGAWMVNLETKERQDVSVSTTENLSTSYITFCEGGTHDRKNVVNFISQLYDEVKDIRKLGSAALECAWVGLGRADTYITPEIHIWDIAAGMLFVSEAGGRIMDFELNPYEWTQLAEMKEINLVAANKNLNLPHIKYN